MYAPIALFVYNRINHTKQIIECLKKNKLSEKSELFIFSDGPKNNFDKEKVNKIREYLRTIDGFAKIYIVENEENKGLANSIIEGVTKVITENKKIIVLEDDLLVSDDFLDYMNNCLNYYEFDKRIWSISGYNFPIKIYNKYKKDVYLSYRVSSWGYATWKDRWDLVDWEVKDFKSFIINKEKIKDFNMGGEDLSELLKKQNEGKINSWAIRWNYSQYKNKMYTLYPVVSKVKNIGFDGTGTHCGVISKYNVTTEKKEIKLESSLEVDNKIISQIKKITKKSIKEKIKESIVKLMKKIYKW